MKIPTIASRFECAREWERNRVVEKSSLLYWNSQREAGFSMVMLTSCRLHGSINDSGGAIAVSSDVEWWGRLSPLLTSPEKKPHCRVPNVFTPKWTLIKVELC